MQHSNDITFDEAVSAKAEEIGRVFAKLNDCIETSIKPALQGVGLVALELYASIEQAYDEAGAPYGHDEDGEGIRRWVADLRAQNDARWRVAETRAWHKAMDSVSRPLN